LAAVKVVPHTHWDREWYLPFQSFRLRLVGLVDRLLDFMEADHRYRFTLDGQLATVEDYLEIRAEAEARIRRLVEAKRLAVGPWQVLMDEFFVSGETIIRNLEQGLRRGDELGGAMRVGYLPDMFGHVAQMPQILTLASTTQSSGAECPPRSGHTSSSGRHPTDRRFEPSSCRRATGTLGRCSTFPVESRARSRRSSGRCGTSTVTSPC
jgi:hypothetical protein